MQAVPNDQKKDDQTIPQGKLGSIFFTNSLVLSFISIFLIVNLLIAHYSQAGIFFSISSGLFGTFSIIFSILQLYSLFEPLLKQFHKDETSLEGQIALVFAILCIILPFLFITKSLWSNHFFVGVLSSFILFLNAISCTSKNYRDSSLSFYTNLGYASVCIISGILYVFFNVSLYFLTFPVILLFCLFCFAKSSKMPPASLRQKVNSTDAIFTTILAALAFLIGLTLFMISERGYLITNAAGHT